MGVPVLAVVEGKVGPEDGGDGGAVHRPLQVGPGLRVVPLQKLVVPDGVEEVDHQGVLRTRSAARVVGHQGVPGVKDGVLLQFRKVTFKLKVFSNIPPLLLCGSPAFGR